jgi:hypothetical protein
MSTIWRNHTIHWKDPSTWVGRLSHWIKPFLNRRGIRHLQRMSEQKLCWDDPIWLEKTQEILDFDVQCVTERLGLALSGATIRTFHGCRPRDAGIYLRNGILCNDPKMLASQARHIVMEEEGLHYLQATIDQRLTDFKERDRDTGRLYLALDDRTLRDGGGHYLLYGSEWLQCLFGFEAHDVLRRRGVPTVVLVDLPLAMTHEHERRELSEALLQEWTRIKVNRPNWCPERDFTFILRCNVSGSFIAGHYHPETVCDPFYQNVRRSIESRYCPSCAPVAVPSQFAADVLATDPTKVSTLTEYPPSGPKQDG